MFKTQFCSADLCYYDDSVSAQVQVQVNHLTNTFSNLKGAALNVEGNYKRNI